MSEPRIVIVIEGGMVQGVLSDRPAEVMVVDYDIEGLEENELVSIPQGEGIIANAKVYWEAVMEDLIRVQEIQDILITST